MIVKQENELDGLAKILAAENWLKKTQPNKQN
jgi:hypothetical protein